MNLTNNDQRVVDRIKENLVAEGISVGPIIIKAIVSEYLGVKRDALLNGDSFFEEGIGNLNPSWRRVPSNFSEKKFTSLIKCEVDGYLKESMNDKIIEDANYAMKVGALDVHKEFNK